MPAARTSAVVLFLLLPNARHGFGAAPWLNVPFVRQTGAGCGAAAVAMVVQYWASQDARLAEAASATERIDKDLAAGADGLTGTRLKAYLESHGFEVRVFNGDSTDLEHEFRRGRPLLVCFAPRGLRHALHYAVVAGVDGRSVWLNDPGRGKLVREPLAPFERAWKLTGNWSLMAVPRTSP